MKTIVRTLTIYILLFFISGCKNNTEKNNAEIEQQVVVNEPAVPELKTITVNNYEIKYMDVGNGDPVIFVHGSLGDYRSWASQIDTFSINHRVIAYSRRYAYPNLQVINDTLDYSALPHAKDLAKIIETLDLGPVNLVGHSWGAFTALKTTIDRPELVTSLVLGEPPVQSIIRNTKIGDSLIDDLVENTLKPSANAFRNDKNTEGISLFIGGVMGDSLMYSKLPESVKERSAQNIMELRGLAINHSFLPIPSNDIQNITTPVLILKGERSPLYLTKISDKLYSLLPNSQLFIIPNSSHGLQNSNPEAFNKRVLEFIDKN